MQYRLAHRVGRSSQATPAAVDKSLSASHTEFLTRPKPVSNGFPLTLPLAMFDANQDYWRELAEYVAHIRGAVQVSGELRNSSLFALTDFELRLTATMESGALRWAEFDSVRTPQPSRDRFHIPHTLAHVLHRKEWTEIKEERGTPTARVLYKQILPGDVVAFPKKLALFPECSGRVTVRAAMYARELQTPLYQTVELDVQVEQEAWGLEKLRDLYLKSASSRKS